MAKKDSLSTYLQKRKAAFQYAGEGIVALFRNEAHAKIHLLAAICVIACGFAFRIALWEWCAISLCIGGVFMGEAFNTAIEKLCDRVEPGRHPLIKVAKDVAAGGVLLFVLAAVAVGLIVFLPKFILLFE